MSKNHRPRFLALFGLVCLFVPAVQAQTGGNIDPVNDLAGLLVPSSAPSPDGSTTGTLYVMPDQQDSVLAALNATPTGGNTYSATISGVSVAFTAVPAALPVIFLPVANLICANSMVRVYKNAQCVPTFPGSTGCSGLPDGSSAQTTFNPIRTCQWGTAFCVEVWQVAWTRTTYFGANCAPPVTGVTTGNGFSC